MDISRLSAFSDGVIGGNPAGVVVGDAFPTENQMLAVAKNLGYSETAFLMPDGDQWRIRYFSPEIEVPFCGHATIASGAELGERFGEGDYSLKTNSNTITVKVKILPQGGFWVALKSPRTWSGDAEKNVVDPILRVFGIAAPDLHQDYPVRIAFAGVRHLIVVLNDRGKLASMSYPFETVRELMIRDKITTISLLWPETDALYHSRNAFAAGGLVEDPATGAAAAAFAGYLRDIGRIKPSAIEILQGFDMGHPCRLFVNFTPEQGSGVQVGGYVRRIG